MLLVLRPADELDPPIAEPLEIEAEVVAELLYGARSTVAAEVVEAVLVV